MTKIPVRENIYSETYTKEFLMNISNITKEGLHTDSLKNMILPYVDNDNMPLIIESSMRALGFTELRYHGFVSDKCNIPMVFFNSATQQIMVFSFFNNFVNQLQDEYRSNQRNLFDDMTNLGALVAYFNGRVPRDISSVAILHHGNHYTSMSQRREVSVFQSGQHAGSKKTILEEDFGSLAFGGVLKDYDRIKHEKALELVVDTSPAPHPEHMDSLAWKSTFEYARLIDGGAVSVPVTRQEGNTCAEHSVRNGIFRPLLLNDDGPSGLKSAGARCLTIEETRNAEHPHDPTGVSPAITKCLADEYLEHLRVKGQGLG